MTFPRPHSKLETNEGLEPRSSSLPPALHPHSSDTFCREKLRTGWPERKDLNSVPLQRQSGVLERAGRVDRDGKVPDSEEKEKLWDMVTMAVAALLVWEEELPCPGFRRCGLQSSS